MNPRSSTPFVALFCVVIAFVAGLFMGGHPGSLPGSVRDAFGLSSDEDQTRSDVLKSIEDSYYKPVDAKKLRDGGYDGLVDSLHDRFSHYFSPAETKEFNRVIRDPRFEGIGVSVAESRQGLRIVQVYDGSPAAREGLLKEDLIVAVAGKSIAGQPSNVSTTKIKGKAGTQVRLTVLTPSTKRRREVTLERAEVHIPAVESEMVTRDGQKVAHVRLAGFSSGAHGQLRAAIDKLLKQGAKGVVLDLRGNGGGLLEEGVLVSSIFIENGTIVSTRGRSRPERKFPAEGDAIDPKIPVVVLVDSGSASASEITTGALRDTKRATVVGTKTFGKGVFQEVQDLPNGGSLDLTVGSYYLPSGENISGKGIEPTVAAKDDPKTRRDEALPIAVKTVIAKIPRR